jgi:hypothetical protein
MGAFGTFPCSVPLFVAAQVAQDFSEVHIGAFHADACERFRIVQSSACFQQQR